MTMREKLIELIDAVLLYLPWGEVTPHTAADIADRIIDSGICDESKWIPVTERLPEKGKAVLCFCTNNDCWIALWDRCDDQLWSDGEWWRAKDFVTHWMPLPPAPEENK